ncbi:DUF4097 family beta strand repeat-containing protein [Amycolatopsis viridis]|uniref:Adhesin domain-containing protein n=1 Tax=Amycolatopsis viridis TaxID=185678 RepID=A0ABX0SV45_9PSEU|nr:DUF4097 domain-containing protein [Amycolatopsis viridis]NIH80832.1 hypothetical protein [Amycolatopsis viridis]
MPAFDTPEPITVAVDLLAGEARFVASDRVDTVVEVRPGDPDSEADIRAAEQARVEYDRGRLVVKAAKPGLFAHGGALDVRVALPLGSDVRGNAASAAFRSTGRLGECRFKTATGDVQLDATGSLLVEVGRADVSAECADGRAEITVGSGTVRLGEVHGPVVVRNAGGDTWIGRAGAGVRVHGAKGTIIVDHAEAAVEAKTGHGTIRVGEVRRGPVVLETGGGDVEFGVREGTSARVDVSTRNGRVENLLTASDGPRAGVETAEIRARTSAGDIVIRRA